MVELPVFSAGRSPRERADAARNRRRILEAASGLVEEHGIGGVSMDDVARAASVGTGTLYRRFGDRAGLALALLDEQTRAFQNELIAGLPPLGPGAPAGERLRAFGHGYLDVLELHADLLSVASPSGRDGEGPRQFYATHIAILVAEAAPRLDAQWTAEALLAVFSPEAHVHCRKTLGWSLERLNSGWDALIGALVES